MLVFVNTLGNKAEYAVTTLLNVFAIVFALILAYRILRYLTTPLFIRIGWYQYFAPMFFILRLPGNLIEIHLGTSYDFFRRQAWGPKSHIASMAEGMIKLCDAIERGAIHKDTTIKACLYFFDDKHLQQFGFTTRRLNFFELFLFGLNFLELTLLQSIAKKKFCRPKFRNVRIAFCRAGDLAQRKALFTGYYRRVQSATRSEATRADMIAV